MNLRAYRSLALALLLTGAAAHARADEHHAAKEAEHEAGDAGHGEHHEHEPLTLQSVLTGAESMQFWGAVVNFTLLCLLIRRMSKAPLQNFLTGRRAGIERGIAEANEVKRAAEAAFSMYTERMRSLDSELTKLKKDVADAAERDRVRIVAEANETVARLKSETETLIVRQAEQLETQIRREVVTAAAAAAEKAVRELTTPEDQVRLANAFMRELTKVAEIGAQNGAGIVLEKSA
jgi:F-type H+-transporting ATPase subunit b